MFKKLDFKSPLLPSDDERLSSYTKDPIPVYGKVNLPCKFNDKEIIACFHVVGSKSQALLS
jgi:hypothetical protein